MTQGILFWGIFSTTFLKIYYFIVKVNEKYETDDNWSPTPNFLRKGLTEAIGTHRWVMYPTCVVDRLRGVGGLAYPLKVIILVNLWGHQEAVWVYSLGD